MVWLFELSKTLNFKVAKTPEPVAPLKDFFLSLKVSVPAAFSTGVIDVVSSKKEPGATCKSFNFKGS